MTMVPVERQAEILKAIGLDPRLPLTQALVAVANRYGLDPLLKHIYIIRDSIYVSHSALLHIAHKSGDFDGMEVTCEELPDRWVATARIHRRSYAHPFTYQDECYKNEQKVPDKRKRAITRAERNALRRAFDVEVDVEPEYIERSVTLSPARPLLPGEIEAGGPKADSGLLAVSQEGVQPESSASFDYRPAVILCREIGLPENLRHKLAQELTGRTESVKEMTKEEFTLFMAHLEDLKAGAIPSMLPTPLREEIVTWLGQRESLTKTPSSSS